VTSESHREAGGPHGDDSYGSMLPRLHSEVATAYSVQFLQAMIAFLQERSLTGIPKLELTAFAGLIEILAGIPQLLISSLAQTQTLIRVTVPLDTDRESGTSYVIPFARSPGLSAAQWRTARLDDWSRLSNDDRGAEVDATPAERTSH